MDEYIYITCLIKNLNLYLGDLKTYINLCSENNQYLKTNYYDLISVYFIDPHTHQYELEKYETKIKTSINIETVQIENKYLLDNKYSPFVLVKL